MWLCAALIGWTQISSIFFTPKDAGQEVPTVAPSGASLKGLGKSKVKVQVWPLHIILKFYTFNLFNVCGVPGQQVSGGLRTTWRSEFSPSAVWAAGLNTVLQVVANAFPCWAISPSHHLSSSGFNDSNKTFLDSQVRSCRQRSGDTKDVEVNIYLK